MKEKVEQLRDLTGDELVHKRIALKKELFDLRHQIKVGRVDKPHKISHARKQIARIETILTERLRQSKVSEGAK